MKKSNKVIALIFGLLILVPALVVATILIRYKNGDFTRVDRSQMAVTKDLRGTNNITLKGLMNLEIIPADSFSLAWDVNKNVLPPEFSIRKDSAFFSGISNKAAGGAGKDNIPATAIRERFEPVVKLYLPSGKTVSLIDCIVNIHPENTAASFQELGLKLSNSNLSSDMGDDGKIIVDTLHIDADNTSTVSFTSFWEIGWMDLILKNESEFKGGKARFRGLSINVDSSSQIMLSGQQLKSIIQKK